MPIYRGNSQNRRIIIIKSAGRPQYFAGADCIPGSIFLQAELNDTKNLRNDTFEWDHVPGEGEVPLDLAPVAGASPIPETRASFTPPVTDEDQVFEFFMNRGTNREQSARTKIYYTPTSFFHEVALEAVYEERESTIPNLTQEPDSLPIPNRAFQSFVEAENGSKILFDKTAIEKIASNQEGFDVLYSSTGGNNPTEVLVSYNKYNWPTSISLARGAYRIRVYYKVDKRRIVYFTSPIVVANTPIISRSIASHDVFHNASAVGDLTFLRRISPQTISQNETFKVTNGYNYDRATVTRFGNQKIDEILKPELVDGFSVKLASQAELINLVRNNIQGIGED